MRLLIAFVVLAILAGTAQAQTYPKFVGSTTSSTGSAGGYFGAVDKCRDIDTQSRVCTSEDIAQILGRRKAIGAVGWIWAGPPSDVNGTVNECDGWTNNAANRYGRVWAGTANATGGLGSTTPCNSSLPFLCCK